MPDRDDLPEGLQNLAMLNAVQLDHETFRADVFGLLDAVERVLSDPSHKAGESTVSSGTGGSEQAIGERHSEQAFKAVNLGLQLAEQGDFTGARAVFKQVIDSGHVDQAPEALVSLGCCSRKRGMMLTLGLRTSRPSIAAMPSGHPKRRCAWGGCLTSGGWMPLALGRQSSRPSTAATRTMH